jgi:hypothetical protein
MAPKKRGKPGVNVRPYFTTRGKLKRRIYAKDYGHKGWPIGRSS